MKGDKIMDMPSRYWEPEDERTEKEILAEYEGDSPYEELELPFE